MSDSAGKPDTGSAGYTKRLDDLGSVWWKRALHVQAPYRYNLRRLHLGYVLDIGCGLGRNLGHLDDHGVGIDHNPDTVAVAKSRGHRVFLPEEFDGSALNVPASFDSLLAAHVVEHMTYIEADDLLSRYLPLVKPGGRVVLITPQERGYATDATHVEFMDLEKLERLLTELGLEPTKGYSFPFPRVIGRIFAYNESVSIARVPLANENAR